MKSDADYRLKAEQPDGVVQQRTTYRVYIHTSYIILKRKKIINECIQYHIVLYLYKVIS